MVHYNQYILHNFWKLGYILSTSTKSTIAIYNGMFLPDAKQSGSAVCAGHLGLDSLPLLRNDESEKNERGAEILNTGELLKFRSRVSNIVHLRVEIL